MFISSTGRASFLWLAPFTFSGCRFWIAFENLLGIFCCWNTFAFHFANKTKGVGNNIFIFSFPFVSVVNKLWLEIIMHMACSFLIKDNYSKKFSPNIMNMSLSKSLIQRISLDSQKTHFAFQPQPEKLRIEKSSDFLMSFHELTLRLHEEIDKRTTSVLQKSAPAFVQLY